MDLLDRLRKHRKPKKEQPQAEQSETEESEGVDLTRIVGSYAYCLSKIR